MAHIPWPNSFHYSHLFQWSSGSSFPRFAITVFDRSSGQSNKCSTLLSSGPRMPPPFVTGFVHHRCVKISRHARQALRIALPPLSLSISFNLSAFSSRSSANQHQRESRGTLEIEDSITIISISSRGGRLKWSKIEECDRWRIFDILVYFYNIWLRIRWMDRFRYFSNILLLFERRNWSMINSIDLILIILDIYSWIIKLEDWSDIYIFGRIFGDIFSMGSILMYLLFHNR